MLLEGLFPPEVVSADCSPCLLPDQLFPEEWSLVENAVPRRQAQFCGGRLCARRALGELGLSPSPVLWNPDRSPRWPEGVVGSIAHTDTCCGAVVAMAGRISGLGLDLEPDSPIAAGLMPSVCSEVEIDWIQSNQGGEAGRVGRLFFCIKEAAFKCQYPVTGMFIDFHEARVRIEPSTQSFTVDFSGVPFNHAQAAAVSGRYAFRNGLLVAAATLFSAAADRRT